MKIIGIILTVVGVLAFLFGLFATTGDLLKEKGYLTFSDCFVKAEINEQKRSQARVRCGGTMNDCYKQAVTGFESKEYCETVRSHRIYNFIIGLVVAVVGFLAAIVGFVLWRRKKKVML